VTESVEIAEKVDAIGFDEGLKRIYCASGTGVSSSVSISNRGGDVFQTG